MDDSEKMPSPIGELSLKLMTTQRDVNGYGDIYGGWVVAQMDVAGSIHASSIAQGRVVTVAIEQMAFMLPVTVGSSLSFYTQLQNIGTSSIKIAVEVWVNTLSNNELRKVTEASFTFVAVNKKRNTREIVR